MTVTITTITTDRSIASSAIPVEVVQARHGSVESCTYYVIECNMTYILCMYIRIVHVYVTHVPILMILDTGPSSLIVGLGTAWEEHKY